MEKHRPHFPLADIQATVARLGPSAFTKSALDGGRAMGLTLSDMLDSIAAVTVKAFHKSMTTHSDHRVWQDVYRARTITGLAYVKFTVREGAVVISFKRL